MGWFGTAAGRQTGLSPHFFAPSQLASMVRSAVQSVPALINGALEKATVVPFDIYAN